MSYHIVLDAQMGARMRKHTRHTHARAHARIHDSTGTRNTASYHYIIVRETSYYILILYCVTDTRTPALREITRFHV